MRGKAAARPGGDGRERPLFIFNAPSSKVAFAPQPLSLPSPNPADLGRVPAGRSLPPDMGVGLIVMAMKIPYAPVFHSWTPNEYGSILEQIF